MIEHLSILFVSAFFINFVWEVWHSQLYTTCLSMPLPQVIRLLTLMSLKDAGWITLFYGILQITLTPENPLTSPLFLGMFVSITLIFAYAVERHAISTKRWEYAPSMPCIFGVGVTPLLELAVTGVLALAVTFFVV